MTRKPLRLLAIRHEMPYPPHHGGNVVAWRMLRGLSSLGACVRLVCWDNGRSDLGPSRLALEAAGIMATVLHEQVPFARRVSLRYPPRMMAYDLRMTGYRKALGAAAAFRPDAVFLDQYPAYLTAWRLSRDLGAPLVYRSHNAEHSYLWMQWRAARGLMWGKALWNALLLRRAEYELRSRADLVLDICEEDADEWGVRGAGGKWMVVPPIWLEDHEVDTNHPDRRDVDILYVGNLNTPNNVEAVAWLCDAVLPVVRERHGAGLRAVVAGSQPARSVLRACGRASVECIQNPTDTEALVRRARVLVNPQRRGGGVSVKMLELLSSAAPVVATPSAVRGIPRPLRAEVHVAEEAGAFARYVVESLDARAPIDDDARRSLLREHFGPGVLKPFLNRLETMAAR